MTKQTSKGRVQISASPSVSMGAPQPSRRSKKKQAKRTKRPKNIWVAEEDKKLLELIEVYGPSHWSTIASFMPGREGKQCRERWHNHLNPAILKESWTEAEDLRLFLLYKLYGSKWSVLSFMFSGRTDNSIKNHWNSIMKKKVRRFDNYVKNVIETGDLSGLDPLDVDLVERIKRAEFDNKNCRKGRTRDYAGFFQKNGLSQFVNVPENSEAANPQLEVTFAKPAFFENTFPGFPQSAAQLENLKDGKIDLGTLNFCQMDVGDIPFRNVTNSRLNVFGDQHLFDGSPERPLRIELSPEKAPMMMEEVDGPRTKGDRSRSQTGKHTDPTTWLNFGINLEQLDARKPEPAPAGATRDYIASTAKKLKYQVPRNCVEMTPNSSLSKIPRRSGLETTANGPKTDQSGNPGEQVVGLCVTSFFAYQENSAAKSPIHMNGAQSVYSDISCDNCGQHFRNLVTPTKAIFDFSNRKFFNSRSSEKEGLIFSNLKSLDISKSLEYN